MSTSTRLIEHVKLPKFVRADQHFPHSELSDREVAEIFAEQVKAMEGRVKPGQRICITAGSRGIDHMPMMLKSIADWVKSQGGKPFIVPAMGSHGGAVAEGQRALLASLGITEAFGSWIRRFG